MEDFSLERECFAGMLMLIQLALDLSGFFFHLLFGWCLSLWFFFMQLWILQIHFFPISLSSVGEQHLVPLPVTLHLLHTNTTLAFTLAWNNSLNMTSVHPSVFVPLFGPRFQWQKPQQQIPNIPLSNHILYLLLAGYQYIPRPSEIHSLKCVLGLSQGLLTVGHAQNYSPWTELGGILSSCLKHLNWLLLTKSPSEMSELPPYLLGLQWKIIWAVCIHDLNLLVTTQNLWP